MMPKQRARKVTLDWSGDVDELYEYMHPPTRCAGRLPQCSEKPITVTDDWPQVVPITDAELRVMESHFAEELDEILGPRA